MKVKPKLILWIIDWHTINGIQCISLLLLLSNTIGARALLLIVMLHAVWKIIRAATFGLKKPWLDITFLFAGQCANMTWEWVVERCCHHTGLDRNNGDFTKRAICPAVSSTYHNHEVDIWGRDMFRCYMVQIHLMIFLDLLWLNVRNH